MRGRSLELREYWLIVRRWWWLLVLCTLLGGGASFLVTYRQPRTYQASTLLMFGASVGSREYDQSALDRIRSLAQTYAQLLKLDKMRESVRDALGLPFLPSASASLVPNTNLLRITVADTQADRSALIADEMARQLILQSPSAPERQEQAYREFVESQLADLESEIDQLSEAILSAKEMGDSERVTQLQEALSVRRANYSSLISYLKGSSVLAISVFEPARVPTSPRSPDVERNSLLGAVVGLMIATGIAFLIEYLDDSIKGPAEIEEQLQLPTLGTISEMTTNGVHPERIVDDDPISRFAEGYRMLWTNLRYSVPGNPRAGFFLVTSVEPGAGKTTTASNLAIVAADSGRPTILIDADMRRSYLHRIWDCDREPGLSALLVGETESLDDVLRPTTVDRLLLLPAGRRPPNPAELLGSPRMIELMQELAERAEVVVLDAPPVFAVADARILASLVTGTLLVADLGRTRLQAFAEALDELKKGGVVLGAVLNRLDLDRRGYYYYYHSYGYYDHYYGYGDSGDDSRGDRRKKRRRKKRETEATEAT